MWKLFKFVIANRVIAKKKYMYIFGIVCVYAPHLLRIP